MFANKLGKPVDDENLPMRLFLESLEGNILDWYSNLKSGEIKTWLDLSIAFVKQYEFNCELAPTRTTLEGTKKKPSEDHKIYAKRWRKLAAKVEPPMTEDEIFRTFIMSHDPPYFEEIFRLTGISFAAIIKNLEEYDEFVKVGKIVNVSALILQLDALQNQNNNGKKPPFKKKEGETLKAVEKIGTVPPKGLPPGYDAQVICAYHSESPGHTTGNCSALKHKIQDMIDSEDILLRRRGEQGSNVSKNPLPEHGSTVGVIITDEDFIDPT
ncbi:uncharacterized protein [Coffea arabica]|uniref:Retrotransposon gag domain-containing protein n=1 Tax=Coffea arabica TaxID=13443 RepID=A0ABM4U621_COFAR